MRGSIVYWHKKPLQFCNIIDSHPKISKSHARSESLVLMCILTEWKDMYVQIGRLHIRTWGYFCTLGFQYHVIKSLKHKSTENLEMFQGKAVKCLELENRCYKSWLWTWKSLNLKAKATSMSWIPVSGTQSGQDLLWPILRYTSRKIFEIKKRIFSKFCFISINT